jgi:hypothetical protein
MPVSAPRKVTASFPCSEKRSLSTVPRPLSSSMLQAPVRRADAAHTRNLSMPSSVLVQAVEERV